MTKSRVRWLAVVGGPTAAMAAALGGCRATNNAPANGPPSAPLAQPAPGYASSPPPPAYPGTYYAPSPGYPQPAGPAQPQYAPQPPPPGAPLGPGVAQGPYPPAQTQAPPPAMAPGAAPSTSAPLAPTDPNSLQSILAGIQGALQGILVAPGSLPVDVAEAGLKAQAFRFAPGMQPEGSELKQNLAEGQHAFMMVTLQAGKCYTLVGFSPPGAVKDLDLNLLAPPFYVTLAGQDLTHDNAPSIGASPNPMCPVIAFPLQYKLDVFARSGGGQVAVQLYSKAKS